MSLIRHTSTGELASARHLIRGTIEKSSLASRCWLEDHCAETRGLSHERTLTQVARTDYVETYSNLVYSYYRACFIACRVDDLRHDPAGFTVTQHWVFWASVTNSYCTILPASLAKPSQRHNPLFTKLLLPCVFLTTRSRSHFHTALCVCVLYLFDENKEVDTNGIHPSLTFSDFYTRLKSSAHAIFR